jgi:hypothetical protein
VGCLGTKPDLLQRFTGQIKPLPSCADGIEKLRPVANDNLAENTAHPWHRCILSVFGLIAILFSGEAHGADGVIAPTNTVPWTPGIYVGVYGGIPTSRTEWTNFVTAGADPTGVTTCSALLKALLDACPSNKYVYAPQGRYRLATAVNLDGSSDFTLRGAGRTNTVFVSEVDDNPAIKMDNNNLNWIRGIHGSIAQRVTNITAVGWDYTDYVGNMVKIASKNEGRQNLQPFVAVKSDYTVAQITKIIAVTDQTNLTVWPPLYWDHPSDLLPRIVLNTGTQTKRIGFEDFTIDQTALSGSPQALALFGATDCWIKNVQCLGGSVAITAGMHHEIRDSVFTSTAAGSGTYMNIWTDVSASLLENCFGIGGSPFIEANSSWGNVIAYCHTTNNISDDTYIGNPFDHHSGFSMLNLFEGNSGQMFQQDGYHSGAAKGTLFRNWFHTWMPTHSGLPRAIDLNRGSRDFNIVGNILGDARRTGWYYTITNQFYTQTIPVILRLGFPSPGNSSYAYQGPGPGHHYQLKTPTTDWRWPGSNAWWGSVTQETALTNFIHGPFASPPSVALDLDTLTLQDSGNTNLYYPQVTNFTYLRWVSYDSTGVLLNQDIWVTNGANLYSANADTYQQLYLDDASTHLIEWNYDYTNNARVFNTWTSGITLSNSLYLTAKPSWWRDAYSSWPPFDPGNTNTITNLLTAAADYYYPTNATGATVSAVVSGGVLKGGVLR